MNKLSKKLICLFLLITLCFVAGCAQNNNSLDISMPEGGNTSTMFYNEINRALTEEDFAFLRRGLSLEEIVALVGKHDGIVGFNILTPFYILTDGKLFLGFYPPFSATFESLISATIEYPDGSTRTIDLE